MAGASHYILDLPKFDSAPRLLIVVAPYYKMIADNLVSGAKAVAEDAGAKVDIVEVPGALEVPTAIAMAARMADYDGFVALGCVIRGETTHYDTVCNDSSRALTLMGLDGICIGNGILTVENHMQAEVRADPKGQNKGGGAAAAALHLISLSRKWARRTKGIGFKPSESFRIAGETDGSKNA
ncbi:MAG: 6,7-dimethyl-8-ribityllumazine synthase [Thioclava marina]|uniref:6,7-dimethyl-8-ribityllumazine synthase n=1 Tax=Thioclava marina TaxID=1915077 RepID=A0ABX3MNY5_9RHOB|nr:MULTISPECIES: 6,7-dimethyl-8-ribityllumazine synthase [Thioclava]MBC7146921.1 6,7-dimethyl-8-ribityllumazine synthase [Thioclava marina]OOY12878.1 6,7-dimethyl-8-ribityllumazine synthase [Thioclava marina]OOY28103.1 6,7-dimethyl-8-ribityllumazine synthase [Thioclava sp. L04-15]TNE83215.1 MAG: 6,7-dimethyl-8-ribityllumazine synthase [Paracoccaceae bacterium]